MALPSRPIMEPRVSRALGGSEFVVIGKVGELKQEWVIGREVRKK